MTTYSAKTDVTVPDNKLRLITTMPHIARNSLACLYLSLLPALLPGYLDPSKSIAQFGTAQWDHRDGLNSNWITEICQTADDPCIWMGTPTGLARFDGVSFDIFDSKDSPLLQGGTWALEQGPDGRLWIGTRMHGIISYDKGSFSKFSPSGPGSTKLPEVRSILADSRGWLWIGTPMGLYIYKNDTFEGDLSPELGDAFITSLHEGDNGDIWIGTQDHGLYHMPFVDKQRKPISMLLPFETIYCISSDQKGDVWVGVKSGLFQIHGGQLINHLTTDDGLPSNSVRALHLDSAGSLVIGTESGLVRYYNGRITADRSDNPYTGKFITCFYEDPEGSLWVGSKFNGIGQLWSSKFVVYSTGEGLNNPIVNVTYEDQDGTLWIGTNEGLHVLRNGVVGNYRQDIFGQSRVRDILRDSKDNLWICTYQGLYKIKDDSIDLFTIENGLTSNLVRQVLEDSQGRIWIGTRSGLIRFDGNQIRRWKTPSLKNDLILDIVEDSHGDIWISTDGAGIACLEGNTFKWYTTADGLVNGVVFTIYEDTDGLFWLSTANGISVFDGQSFRNLALENGLPSQTVFQIIEDAEGALWITTYDGIFKLEKTQILQYLEGKISSFSITQYGPLDGLRTYQMTGVGQSSLLSDGRLCFSTTEGVAITDFGNSTTHAYKPKVYFEKLLVNSEPHLLGNTALDDFEFGPGVKSLQIEFTSASMIGAANFVFATRLVGFDDAFSESDERSATFTNLGPGDYIFEVRTRNADGIWEIDTDTLAFSIKPYWHQTPWFYLLIVSLSMLAGYGLYFMRLIHLRKQRGQLERMVSERTEEITRQKEIIESNGRENEKTLKALQASNAELKKLSEEKSYFLGVAAHDMKNPLGAIIVLSEELMEDRQKLPDGYYEMVSLIKKSASDMLDLVDTLVHSITLESGELQIEKDSGDLVSTVNSVIEMNRKPSILKEIKLEIDCPDQLTGLYDTLRIRTAMDNYVSNAIKYTPTGGTVRVTLREVESSGARQCEFIVSDSGPGLAESDFDRVFTRFSKLSARPTGRESSSGLGLSIVKQIVTLHGGTVDVKNNSEAGACFSFRIPLEETT